jgi:aminopeptidase N
MMPRAVFAVFAALLWANTPYAASPPAAPLGQLQGTLKPTAYRLELIVDPAATEFKGHTEIDAVLAQPARTLFLHGNQLHVSKVLVTAAGHAVEAHYTQVDDSGVARLDLPADLPAGKVTLTFDYTAGFRTGAEGLFRVQVAGNWYAWTQFEPMDARRVFPGFDEPGFKTPFTVTVTAPAGAKVFANSHEVSAAASGAMSVHHFAPTPPLPTYLVALSVGPFDVIETSVPANVVRKQPLPFRIIATKGQMPRMRLAATEGPKLLGLLESYLKIPYPYEKLDLVGTPILGGAMENAAFIISDDYLLLLDPDAPLSQLRIFAEVTAHEMAHQWFGDLVTPTWWTDIWLNESFAEWMGKKVANQWRPDLGIAAAELSEAFDAMDADSLGKGRPIRQPITQNTQVASAFDSITYQKGAQVLSMFESYLGPDRFAQGVHQYLERYRFGNAAADDFFSSLAASAQDPKIVPALRTFTDQTGVPLVAVSEGPQGLALSQTRYRPLGVAEMSPQSWTIPLCFSRGAARSCQLLESASSTAKPIAGTAALMPNANGAGYYRFRLDGASWDRLIAVAASLPGRDALAVADSLWADFATGEGSFERVVAAARALSTHTERLAAIELGYRLKHLADSALTPAQVLQYRKMMQSIYSPRLAALGLDLKPGAYAKDAASTQTLRQSLLPLVALEARDTEVRAKLTAAAAAYLGGDAHAIEGAFRGTALTVGVQDRGVPFMTQLRDAMVKSADPLFRGQASSAIGGADTPALAQAALNLAFSAGVQSSETTTFVLLLSHQPGARDEAVSFVDKNFKRVIDRFPGFGRQQIIDIFRDYCSAGDIARADAYVKPKMQTLGGGELELAQVKERIGLCVALRNAKGNEIEAVLAR